MRVSLGASKLHVAIYGNLAVSRWKGNLAMKGRPNPSMFFAGNRSGKECVGSNGETWSEQRFVSFYASADYYYKNKYEGMQT